MEKRACKTFLKLSTDSSITNIFFSCDYLFRFFFDGGKIHLYLNSKNWFHETVHRLIHILFKWKPEEYWMIYTKFGFELCNSFVYYSNIPINYWKCFKIQINFPTSYDPCSFFCIEIFLHSCFCKILQFQKQ